MATIDVRMPFCFVSDSSIYQCGIKCAEAGRVGREEPKGANGRGGGGRGASDAFWAQ